MNDIHRRMPASFPVVTTTPRGEVKLCGGGFHGDVYLTPRKADSLALALHNVADEAVKTSMLQEFKLALLSGNAAKLLNSAERRGLRRAARGKSLTHTQADLLYRKSLIYGWMSPLLTEDGKRVLAQLNISRKGEA